MWMYNLLAHRAQKSRKPMGLEPVDHVIPELRPLRRALPKSAELRRREPHSWS